MANVTIAQFAEVLKVPVDKLLAQLDEAGIKVSSSDDLISDDAKLELLTHLRRSHGQEETPGFAAAPRRITLNRKSQSELRLSGAQGRSHTVNVEVRKKRTYIKRGVLEEQAQQEQEGENQESSNQSGDQNQQSEDESSSDSEDSDNSSQANSDSSEQDASQRDQEMSEEDLQALQEELQRAAEEAEQGDQETQQLTQEELEALRRAQEQHQAMEQWLRRIPNDPGGLLRRKFRYQYQRMGRDQDGNNLWPDDEVQPW